MHRDKIALFLLGIVLLVAAVAILPLTVAAQDDAPAAEGAVGSAALLDADNNAVGQVTISMMPDGLTMVQVSGVGLPAGFHGFHIHTTGECDASGETPFSSAGGHLNPDGAVHPEHAGDLPALYVTANGTAGMAVITDRFTVADLLDEDGSAVMIHSNADNYANIPERYGGPDDETLSGGDSGARFACGVITTGGEAAAG